MKTMKDYHDLHLKCDVLLLAGVFEKFRNNTIKNYGLCPSQNLSAQTSLKLGCNAESLCPLFFINFLFLHQMIALQKL